MRTRDAPQSKSEGAVPQEPFPWGVVIALCIFAAAIAIIAIGRGWL
jgi:hypothetical protein